MYKNIIFDLDGTITDPGIGITNGVIYALKKYNIEVKNREELYVFIGPPLLDSFQRYFGFSEKESEQAIIYYREYYREIGLYENEVYENIEYLFKELKRLDKKIYLATSKPEEFARKILKHYNLDQYFDYIGGATFDKTRSEKDLVIKYVLETNNITNLEETIMVGDRNYDVIGARKNNLDCIGVLYGYGNKQEFKDADTKYIVKDVLDILEIVK